MRFLRYLSAALALMVVFSCEKAPQDSIVITSDSNIVFTAEGGTATVSFTASGFWTASLADAGASSWLSVSPNQGTTDDTITLFGVFHNCKEVWINIWFTIMLMIFLFAIAIIADSPGFPLIVHEMADAVDLFSANAALKPRARTAGKHTDQKQNQTSPSNFSSHGAPPRFMRIHENFNIFQK